MAASPSNLYLYFGYGLASVKFFSYMLVKAGYPTHSPIFNTVLFTTCRFYGRLLSGKRTLLLKLS